MDNFSITLIKKTKILSKYGIIKVIKLSGKIINDTNGTNTKLYKTLKKLT